MIRSTIGVATVFSIALVAACGDDEAPAYKYPTSDSFCTGKAAAECKAVAASCGVTEDACTAARKNACSTFAGTATSQGRTYRPTNAEACIDKTADLYAARTLDAAKTKAYEEACQQVFTGDRKKSDPCNNAYLCEGALVCDVDKGFCADKVAKKKDDPCNNPGDICDTGLFCEDTGGTKFCRSKRALGANCSATAPCAEDAFCNGTACVALQPGGAACTTSAECVTHFCNPDQKTCAAAQFASETGTCKDFGGT